MVKESTLGRMLRQTLSAFPLLYTTAKIVYQTPGYLRWKGRCLQRRLENRTSYTLIYPVKTTDIQMCTEKEFSTYFAGIRLSGEWDRATKRFEELDIHIAFSKHFKNSVAWQDTQYYQTTLNNIQAGYAQWGCNSESELKERCTKLDTLFLHIKVHGYKQQTELPELFSFLRGFDEILVNISRDGKLLFNDGAHRLSIAKLLHMETVPVRINVIHKACTDFSKIGKGLGK